MIFQFADEEIMIGAAEPTLDIKHEIPLRKKREKVNKPFCSNLKVSHGTAIIFYHKHFNDVRFGGSLYPSKFFALVRARNHCAKFSVRGT